MYLSLMIVRLSHGANKYPMDNAICGPILQPIYFRQAPHSNVGWVFILIEPFFLSRVCGASGQVSWYMSELFSVCIVVSCVYSMLAWLSLLVRCILLKKNKYATAHTDAEQLLL